MLEVLDFLPAGILVLDIVAAEDIKIIFANKAALAVLGRSHADVLGRPLCDFVDPELAKFAQSRMAAAVAGQALPELEYRLQRGDGRVCRVRCQSRRLPGIAAGASERVLTTIRDADELPTPPGPAGDAHASTLRRQNWALNAYSRSLSAIVRPGQLDAQLAHICQALVDESPYKLASIAIPVDAPGRPVRCVASAGPASAYLDGLQVSWAADVPEGRGPGGLALRDGVPTIVSDVVDAAVMVPWQQRLQRFGLKSTVTVPCMAAGKPVAALGVYSSVPNAFGPEELAVFQRLSDEIGFLISLDAERTQFRAADARLAELVERGPAILFQSIVSPGRSEKMIYTSPNMAEITGYSMEILADQERSWHAMTDPAINAQWPEVRERALQTGATQWEYPLRRADGTILRILSSSRAEPRGDGSWLLTGTMLDVTAQRAAEAELERARRQMQLAVDAGPGALMLQRVYPDKPAECSFVSAAIERITGYTAAETMVSAVREATVHPDDIAALAASDAKTLAMEPSELTFRVRTKTGEWRWLHAAVRPVERRADGSVDEVIYVEDVTGQKEQQARALHTAELMMLCEMTTSMAHELNQPLAIMSMAAENALRDVNDPARAPMVVKRLERIQEQAMRAGKVIEQLRVFGRSHEMEPGIAPLQTVIEGGLVLGRIKLRNSGVALTGIVQPGLHVQGNVLLLEQVVLNLISSACDAYDTRAAAGHTDTRVLDINAALADGRVVISVADRAGGIPESVLSRVFEPFFTTKLASKGTGVGLSFCFGVIADMQGTITAHNADGGAVFTISLPAGTPEAVPCAMP